MTIWDQIDGAEAAHKSAIEELRKILADHNIPKSVIGPTMFSLITSAENLAIKARECAELTGVSK